MHDIFISYSHEDMHHARELASDLEKEGFSVWWDRAIPAGKSFDDVIQNAIDTSGCILVLWSKQSVQSNWVKAEAGEGQQKGTLIPVLVEQTDIPLGFRRIQAANLIDWNKDHRDPIFTKLVADIRQIIGKPVDSKQASVPVTQKQETRKRVTTTVPASNSGKKKMIIGIAAIALVVAVSFIWFFTSRPAEPIIDIDEEYNLTEVSLTFTFKGNNYHTFQFSTARTVGDLKNYLLGEFDKARENGLISEELGYSPRELELILNEQRDLDEHAPLKILKPANNSLVTIDVKPEVKEAFQWKKCKEADSIESYTSFLTEFPESSHAMEADDRLNELKSILVGEKYQGGIIYKIDNTGKHGKAYHKLVDGQGKLKRELWNQAELECSRLSVEGFDDWYMPSREQLKELYDLNIINWQGEDWWSKTTQDGNHQWHWSLREWLSNQGHITPTSAGTGPEAHNNIIAIRDF